jgi:alpha-amylase/alpha-mannosidase (GH57 family)
MERYLCIHGHFYQPPRENPWLEAIEIQDSAHPYHDWNEKIAAECYAPNSASRVLDGEGRIVNIVNNYARMSFNFGPTLLAWTARNAPHVYEAVLEADRQSIEWRSGHGNAIAQAYNHMIMPLANRRDKLTQVAWGMRDFASRFGRSPEGMWLPETAVDMETLGILAESGIRFTLLSPRQAQGVRRLGTGRWKDVRGGRIDPSRPYLCRLPAGRTIAIFFYDGPVSHAVAFEQLLNRGEDFVNRLLSGFSGERSWPQLLHIATDGETYGHHHRFGDMALAYALNSVESRGAAALTNYGEYLERFPPTHEVQIIENSSWSCVHGVERWRGNCGCNSGGNPGWNQEWRAPLRSALDWLRDELALRYEQEMKTYVDDPWQTRDDYITVVLDRSGPSVGDFLSRCRAHIAVPAVRTRVLKLLEMQRHAMLMYTSCGWFFDDISGLETVQVLQYAGRAIQLCDDLCASALETAFLEKLASAVSNLPAEGNGAKIYERHVRPSVVDAGKVGMHYAISSLFHEYPEQTNIFCYDVVTEDYETREAGTVRSAAGRVCVTSTITEEQETVSFCVLHFGGHALNGGVRTYLGDAAYGEMKREIGDAFERGAFADIIRMMDRHFGMHNYSLLHLFKDEQRRIVSLLIGKTMEEFANTYRTLYAQNRYLMGFLQEMEMPIPKAFLAAAELSLNSDLQAALEEEDPSRETLGDILDNIAKWRVPISSVDLEFVMRRRIEQMLENLGHDPFDLAVLSKTRDVIHLVGSLPISLNLWLVQNIYFTMAQSVQRGLLPAERLKAEDVERWTALFNEVGDLLFFNVAAVAPHE